MAANLAELERELRAAREDAAEYEAAAAAAREELRLTREHLQQIQSEKQALRQQLATGKSGDTLKAGDTLRRLDRDQVDFLTDDVKVLQQQLEQAQMGRHEARLNLRAAERRIESYKVEVESLRRDRDMWMKRAMMQSESVSVTDIRRDIYEEESSSRTSLIKQLQREIDELQAERDRLAQQGGNVDSTAYQRALDELDALRMELDESLRVQSEYEQRLAKAALDAADEQTRQAKEIDRLNSELIKAKEELLSLRTKLEETQTKYVSLLEGRHQHRHERAIEVSEDKNCDCASDYSSKKRYVYLDERLQGWSQGRHLVPNVGRDDCYYFPAFVLPKETGLEWGMQGPVWLQVSRNSLSLLDAESWEVLFEVNLSDVRRYGRDCGIFSFEVGRHSDLGQGVFYLATAHSDDMFKKLQGFVRSKMFTQRRHQEVTSSSAGYL